MRLDTRRKGNEKGLKKDKQNASACVKKTTIGGQALIEGIMMRSPKKSMMAVRNPQGEIVLGAGLLGTYAAAAVLRSVLEPKLVGKQLGLDPLVTLGAMYAGYRLWGIGGMILFPLLAAMTVLLVRKQ